ncbi:MAG: hypothetical protein H0W74_14070 [Sphingosinicella sp.]|nr:hypothetical protein [Sphingosinicella sp.]
MAAGWVGGAEQTGIKDIRGLIPLYNERIALTAQKRGISRAQALRGFIRGEFPLAAIGGIGVGGGLLSQQEKEEEGSLLGF